MLHREPVKSILAMMVEQNAIELKQQTGFRKKSTVEKIIPLYSFLFILPAWLHFFNEEYGYFSKL